MMVFKKSVFFALRYPTEEAIISRKATTPASWKRFSAPRPSWIASVVRVAVSNAAWSMFRRVTSSMSIGLKIVPVARCTNWAFPSFCVIPILEAGNAGTTAVSFASAVFLLSSRPARVTLAVPISP